MWHASYMIYEVIFYYVKENCEKLRILSINTQSYQYLWHENNRIQNGISTIYPKVTGKRGTTLGYLKSMEGLESITLNEISK